jgi:Ni/Co efflux regulator RcnB
MGLFSNLVFKGVAMKKIFSAAALGLVVAISSLSAPASALAFDRYDRHDRSDRYDRHDRGDRWDRGNRGGRWDRDNRRDRYDRSDRRNYERGYRSGWRDRSDWRRGGYVSYRDWDRGYYVDYRRHRHLYAPPRGYEWRRVDNNYVLAAAATGLIAGLIIGGY